MTAHQAAVETAKSGKARAKRRTVEGSRSLLLLPPLPLSSLSALLFPPVPSFLLLPPPSSSLLLPPPPSSLLSSPSFSSAPTTFCPSCPLPLARAHADEHDRRSDGSSGGRGGGSGRRARGYGGGRGAGRLCGVLCWEKMGKAGDSRHRRGAHGS